MPRIERPNTDARRLKALSKANAKVAATPPANVVLNADTLAALGPFLTSFGTEVQERGSALSAQATAVAAANPLRTVLRIHISHFIQVFNLGVDRAVYPAPDRAHYGLDVSSERLPQLTSDSDLDQWGNSIASGDAARVAAGGAPMVNPTAAEVAAQFALFQPVLADLTTKKDTYDSEQEDVEDLRVAADSLIADIWDEVLFEFRKDTAPSMRRKAREYGVVYRLSPGEAPDPEEFSMQGTATTDAAGTPLPDVEVTVVETNEAVLTEDDGTYLMPLQPDGTYSVQFKLTGYATQVIPDVVMTAGSIATLDAVMVAEP